MQAYFIGLTMGVPLLIAGIAVLGGYLNREEDNDQFSLKGINSVQIQARREQLELDQMLAAQNELRRRRGVPARTMEEVTENISDW